MTDKPEVKFVEVDIQDAILTAMAIALREAVTSKTITPEVAERLYNRTETFAVHLARGDVVELHNEDEIKIIPREERADYQAMYGDKSDNLIIGG